MITTRFADKLVEHFKKTPQIPPSRSTNVEILQYHPSNHVWMGCQPFKAADLVMPSIKSSLKIRRAFLPNWEVLRPIENWPNVETGNKTALKFVRQRASNLTKVITHWGFLVPKAKISPFCSLTCHFFTRENSDEPLVINRSSTLLKIMVYIGFIIRKMPC